MLARVRIGPAIVDVQPRSAALMKWAPVHFTHLICFGIQFNP